MSWLIQSLEVLNLPCHWPKTQWKIWDKIDLQGWKNLLLVGWNGTGKSTMLQILNKSIDRAKKVLEWNDTLLMNPHPYDTFSICFDGDTWKIEPYGHESEEWYSSENYQEDLINAFTYCLKSVYWEWIVNFWDTRYTSTSSHLHKIIKNYVEKQNSNAWYKWYEAAGNAFNVAQDVFHKAAELFAKQNGIVPEVVYWNLVLIFEWNHWKLLNSAAQWWYIKPQWDESKILWARKIVLWADELKNESLWERSKRIVEEIRDASWNVIAILDEPTNGVDRKSIWTHRDSILDINTNVQIIAASHDEWLMDRVEASKNWVVYDLDEKNN